MELHAYGSDLPDLFDSIPDPILLSILNKVSDAKTLTRCRSISKRFNFLVPECDSLSLRVDRVISPADSEEEGTDDLSFLSFLRSIFKSFHKLVSPTKQPVFPNPTLARNFPSRVLRGFDTIRTLRIELPSGDLNVEKQSTIKWKAHFGETLKSCVILGFSGGAEAGDFVGSALKTRVVWTISALIAASARHYMMVDVIKEQNALTKLVIEDKDGEGVVIMDKLGLKEARLSDGDDEELDNSSVDTNNGGGMGILSKSKRTKVPAVRMRMRYEEKIELSNGVTLEGATLVVVRPMNNGGCCGGWKSDTEEQSGDVDLAMEAFGGDGVYGEGVKKLLKSKSYILEMNSF